MLHPHILFFLFNLNPVSFKKRTSIITVEPLEYPEENGPQQTNRDCITQLLQEIILTF